jgi:hypothetical protein
VLPPDQSAALCDRLITELDPLKSPDEAAGWALKSLAAKNTLATDDAKLVEAAFQARLAAFAEEPPESAPQNITRAANGVRSHRTSSNGPDAMTIAESAAMALVDPAELAAKENAPVRRRVAGKTIRLRDKEHCKFVAAEPCIVCGRTPADAHHLRFAQPRALGRKVSDGYTVPLCRGHHRELHRYGDEVSWWAGVNIDPVPIALALWRRSRPNRVPILNGQGPRSQVWRSW